MKWVLLSIFIVLLGMTALSQWWQPKPYHGGRTPIVWVTGFNAERVVQAELFNELQDDYHLSIDPDNTGTQKIIVQISSGVGPDLFDMYGAANMQTLVEAGVVENLRPYFNEAGIDYIKTNYPAIAEGLTFGDGVWGYPSNVNTNVAFYNKDVFDRLGVPYPPDNMTWEAFIEMAEKLRVDSPRQSERVVPVSRMTWQHFFSSKRGEYFSEDGTELLLTSDLMRECMEMHREMIFDRKLSLRSLEARSLSAETGAGGHSADFTLFMNGFYGVLIVGKWALIDMRLDYEYRRMRKEAGMSDEPLPRIGVMRVPYFEGYAPCYLVSFRAAGISAEAEDKQGSFEFIKYLSGKAYSETINRGLDALPGNPEFAWDGIEELYPELSELKAHQLTVQSMEEGYAPRLSPFLLMGSISRALNHMLSRLESNPTLDIDELLEAAERQLYREMDRNLARDPLLRARYRELTGFNNPSERLAHQPKNLSQKAR